MKPDADQPKPPESKPGSKPDAKDDLKSLPEAKAEPKPEAKAEPPSDLTPQIAKRAYELYQQRVSQGDPALQDWEQAEREIRKDEAKAEPQPEAKAESKPGAPEESKPKAPESRPGSKPDAKDDLKSLPLPEVEKKLGLSPDGLSQAEAQKRLTQYGPNEIEEKKTNPILKFLSYFWGPIPWMIEVAVILSGVVRHWPDFGIILLLLLANAVVGFWEERQAGNAIEALKATLAIKARVKR